MNIIRKSVVLALGAVIAVGGTSWSGESGGLTSRAEARVGRPLTPVSYAGVARRTTRRTAVVAGATVAAATPNTVVVQSGGYPPDCVPYTDSTGATVYRCP
jgi:hypothetical protein